jgi:hypothetical protein
VLFDTGSDTVTGRNLRRTGRAALSVDLPVHPDGFVHLEGRSRRLGPTVAARPQLGWKPPTIAANCGSTSSQSCAVLWRFRA